MTEGTGTCLRKRGPGGLALVGVIVTLVLAVTSIPILHFYQSYWLKLRTLPAAVVHYESRHGGRWTPLNRTSGWVPKALVATEDRTFFSNLGISFEGIGRALLVDLHTHRFTQGGSTLTQQLARDTLLSPAKTFRRKVTEALLAVMMTALYSKPEILTLYLNEVYFGSGAYGIQSASRVYFGVPADRLTLPQAAMLAGLPQAPSAENPLANFRRAKARQYQVLESMVHDGIISQSEAERAYRAPLSIRPSGA